MLEVRQLTRRYGDYLAVDNVSFEIGKGEIVGLLGHNGAGKTTIMKMISGYLEPNQGSIKLGGFDLSTHAKEAQRFLGYLPENLPLYPEMTVADYLDYAAELKGIDDASKVREVQRVLAATEIQPKALSPINTLSRGYKQRVGVTQALLGNPKLLILDEPTNGLDPTQTDHMRTLIQKLAKEATVILSTHIMQEVDALCDRVLIVRNGQLVVDSPLKSLKHAQQIRLACSLGLDELKTHIQNIEHVSDIEPIKSDVIGGNGFLVHTNEPEQVGHLCAALAKCLIEQGVELYQLQPEVQDLEALFREVNQGRATGAAQPKEVTHAI